MSNKRGKTPRTATKSRRSNRVTTKEDPANLNFLESAIKHFKDTWRESSPDNKNNIRRLFPKMHVRRIESPQSKTSKVQKAQVASLTPSSGSSSSSSSPNSSL